MLTARGRWFLLGSAGLLAAAAAGAPRSSNTLATLALTGLAWFLYEWLRFALRVRFVWPEAKVERSVTDPAGRPAESLWAGRNYTVRVRLSLAGRGVVPYFFAEERVPQGVDQVHGPLTADGKLTAATPAGWSYQFRRPAPGTVRFEGCRVRLTDPHGLFRFDTFVRDPAGEYPVMPPLLDADGQKRTDKRHNALPPPGVHRLRRPGTGSELLDLRDYRPGDPPRMIAWKPSARRDRLITREYESDVPVRCTLLLDGGQSVRLGPPGRTALSQLVDLSAVVSQAALGDRDLVGLGVCTEDGPLSWLNPARTSAQRIEILRRLGEAARLAPTPGGTDHAALLPLAYSLARDVYPDLLDPAVNTLPLTLHWRPILDTRWGWVPVLCALPFLGLSCLLGTAWAFNVPVEDWLPWLTLLALSVLPAGLGVLVLLAHGAWPYLSSSGRRDRRQRKQLAALLATRDRLGPGAVAELAHDDRAFTAALQRFLSDHGVPFPVPLYDAFGRYRFARSRSVPVLGDALLRAVARGRDNELFVVMADLLDLEGGVEPLLKAVRVARARHHEVVVVCPWLPGVPAPGDPQERTGAVRVAFVQRYQDNFAALRRAFGRFGVPLVRADRDDAPRLILERLARLRGVGGRA